MQTLHYTGPRTDDFGLTLGDGKRIVVYPDKPLRLTKDDAAHVLRRWPGLFETQTEQADEAEPLGEAPRSRKRKRNITDVEVSADPASEEAAPVEPVEE